MLGRVRTVTAAVMAFERLWPRLLPLLLVAGLFAAVSWFGLFRNLDDTWRIAIAGAFAIAGLLSIWPVFSWRSPQRHEVDRRIENTNKLVHEPVRVQEDSLAAGDDPFARALWEEHRRRMRDRLAELETGLPRTGVPARDPWALRAIVPLVATIAFAWSFGPSGGRLGDAFTRHVSEEAIAARVDAWITPPAYTGRAPLFLTADANATQTAYSVPAGSIATVRISGGQPDSALTFTPQGSAAESIPEKERDGDAPRTSVRDFEFTLVAPGVLTIAEAGRDWTFDIIADQPPKIALVEAPKRAVNGTLDLTYTIEDDYGAASAGATFALRSKLPDGARPLYGPPELPLSLPRRNAEPPAARTTRDLTDHPWAGLDVAMVLEATDAAGQTGKSEAENLKLPERPFTNPLAKSVVEMRRILSLDATTAPLLRELVATIMLRPEDTIANASHVIGLTGISTRLELAGNDDEKLRDAADYMWEVALGIEDGDLSDAERRLSQAEEALRNALENGASDEEIERLMSELREAIQDYLREFAERSMQNPQMSQQLQDQLNNQQMSQNDLDRMLQQLEDMAKSGSRDQAQQMLDQLSRMLDNLRMAQQGQQGQQQSEMRRQMDRLGELLRRQQELMNETHRMEQMRPGQEGQEGQQGQQGEQQQGQNGRQPMPGQPGQPGQGQQPGQGMTPEEFAEALRQLEEGQRGLQGQLRDLQQALEGMGMQPSDDFSDAGRSMGRAGDRLGEGESGEATNDQADALDALRRGAQDMMQQMQQAMQGDQGGSEDGQGTNRPDDRDPLGRPRATTGPDFGDSVKVPDEIDIQRARQILEAIRKRLGDALSPQLEKEYLERLLDLR